MPANIMLPTKAKMTAFVCSGRSRPKVSQAVLAFACQPPSWTAISTPTSMPTMPQKMEPAMNWRTVESSNSMRVFAPDGEMACDMGLLTGMAALGGGRGFGLQREQRFALGKGMRRDGLEHPEQDK